MLFDKINPKTKHMRFDLVKVNREFSNILDNVENCKNPYEKYAPVKTIEIDEDIVYYMLHQIVTLKELCDGLGKLNDLYEKQTDTLNKVINHYERFLDKINNINVRESSIKIEPGTIDSILNKAEFEIANIEGER